MHIYIYILLLYVYAIYSRCLSVRNGWVYSYIYIYIYINLVIVLSEASCLSCSNSHQATSTAIQAKSQQQKHTCKTQSKAIHIHSFIRPSACMRLLCSMSMHHTKHIFHFEGFTALQSCCAACSRLGSHWVRCCEPAVQGWPPPVYMEEGHMLHAYLERGHGATLLAHICVNSITAMQPPLFTVWVLRVWTMLEKYMPIWLEWEVPCICIYIYIYIHLYRYIYIYIYLYLYTYTYTQTWLRHMLQLNMYIYISSGHAFRQSCRRICYAIIIRLHTNWKCHRAIYNLKSVCL